MNNEPVAWRWKYVKENGEPFTDWQYWHEEPTILNKDKKYLEPLYTHPSKTLKYENHEWDRGIWTVGVDGMTKEFIESSDFHHDVRLYLNGDFETDTQRLNYLQHIADRLNAYPAKTLTDEEILKLEEAEFENYCVDKDSKGRKTATLTDPEWAIWFARAILKKASEK